MDTELIAVRQNNKCKLQGMVYGLCLLPGNLVLAALIKPAMIAWRFTFKTAFIARRLDCVRNRVPYHLFIYFLWLMHIPCFRWFTVLGRRLVNWVSMIMIGSSEPC